MYMLKCGEQNVNVGMWECGNVGMWVAYVATAKMWECGNVGEQNVNSVHGISIFRKNSPTKIS
jgi:hypothetical protein